MSSTWPRPSSRRWAGTCCASRRWRNIPLEHEALVDFAAEEQEAGARPELATQIENLEQYDTIFLGYPNWWADLPMAVYSFLDEYDLAGKTIIPFNVHNGSRFSRTIETIAELEPEATVVENGFTVSERTVAEAAGDVATWLEELGMSGGGDHEEA